MYQATVSFEQNAHYVPADVPEVDYQFATEPMTPVKLAEQQVNEEELLSLFEQAVSDRMEAINPCANRVSEPLTHQPNTTGDREGLVPARSYVSPRQGSSALPNVLMPLAGTRGAAIWSSLMSNPWQRGVTLVSLALLLLMIGFDLMGLLVLLMRLGYI